MTDATQTPALWEGALEEARSLIGVELRRTGQPWNTEASPDAVRHVCWGIGDDNPLFTDPAYGAATRHGAAAEPSRQIGAAADAVMAGGRGQAAEPALAVLRRGPPGRRCW